MKKSEDIRIALENLEAEKDITIKQMVFENPARTAENHDQLWSAYWRAFGRAYADKKDTSEWELRKARNSEVEIGDGVTEYLYSDAHVFTVIAKTRRPSRSRETRQSSTRTSNPSGSRAASQDTAPTRKIRPTPTKETPMVKRSDATGASAWVATQQAVTRALRSALAATSFTTTTSKLPPGSESRKALSLV